MLITNRIEIAKNALDKANENDAFRIFAKNTPSHVLDELTNKLNNKISPQIDCTTCGGCCRHLMINVTPNEVESVAKYLNIAPNNFEEKYIEKSLQGKMIMNTIPCHFLADNKCTIYESRFAGCREFPHLQEPNIKDRLFSTLIHYAMCPIIYNVVEALKVALNFKLV